jgi:hypothetical protein
MNDKKNVKQIQFKSLEEFIKRKNNFHSFFYNSPYGNFHRETKIFEEFKLKYPKLEEITTKYTTKSIDVLQERQDMPHRALWGCYRRMSKLLLEHKQEYGIDDRAVLIR